MNKRGTIFIIKMFQITPTPWDGFRERGLPAEIPEGEPGKAKAGRGVAFGDPRKGVPGKATANPVFQLKNRIFLFSA